MRTLVCAATRAEHDACRRGIVASGGAAASGYETLLTGVGPVRAARTLGRRLERGDLPDLVVSAGFAGALSADIPLSTWITGARVREWDAARSAAVELDGVALALAPGLARCDVLSSSILMSQELVANALIDESREGGRFAPLVGDMESAALAREACRRGVRFAVARVISDTPAHPMPGFVSPFAAALAAPAPAARLIAAARGVRAAARDPRGVVRFVRDSSAWLRVLEDGWTRLRGDAWV